jgi:hypothetical protein
MFFAYRKDDQIPIEGRGLSYLVLKKNGVLDCELHTYFFRGYYKGLNPSKPLFLQWPDRASVWLQPLPFFKSE